MLTRIEFPLVPTESQQDTCSSPKIHQPPALDPTFHLLASWDSQCIWLRPVSSWRPKGGVINKQFTHVPNSSYVPGPVLRTVSGSQMMPIPLPTPAAQPAAHIPSEFTVWLVPACAKDRAINEMVCRLDTVQSLAWWDPHSHLAYSWCLVMDTLPKDLCVPELASKTLTLALVLWSLGSLAHSLAVCYSTFLQLWDLIPIVFPALTLVLLKPAWALTLLVRTSRTPCPRAVPISIWLTQSSRQDSGLNSRGTALFLSSMLKMVAVCLYPFRSKPESLQNTASSCFWTLLPVFLHFTLLFPQMHLYILLLYILYVNFPICFKYPFS